VSRTREREGGTLAVTLPADVRLPAAAVDVAAGLGVRAVSAGGGVGPLSSGRAGSGQGDHGDDAPGVPLALLVAPCAFLALITFDRDAHVYGYLTLLEFCWTFSIYLEGEGGGGGDVRLCVLADAMTQLA